MITERDYYNILETAKKEGREAGYAEGEAKGREAGLAEGEARVAKNMLAAGMPEEQIIEFTGLSAEQLAALK